MSRTIDKPATDARAEALAVLLLARACLEAKVSLWQVSAAVQRIGSAQQVLEADFEPQTRWELEVRSAANHFAGELAQQRERLEEELDGWLEAGLRLTHVLADDYPLNLRYVYDRPPFLFYRGTLHSDDAYALAVVGTRKPSEAGRQRARKMARLLCEEGITVLSGLALGIDGEAHAAALEAGGRTVAVLGSGHFQLYPKQHAELAERIPEQGAVVSQFFPTTPPTRRTFPLRNTVTSGMGQGTIVIQASATSGARLQARLAIEHGKHAFLLRSLVEEYEWAREFAEKRGAVVVSEVSDVLPYLVRPQELERQWDREAERILADTAEPPIYVQRRLAAVAARNQEQLSF